MIKQPKEINIKKLWEGIKKDTENIITEKQLTDVWSVIYKYPTNWGYKEEVTHFDIEQEAREEFEKQLSDFTKEVETTDDDISLTLRHNDEIIKTAYNEDGKVEIGESKITEEGEKKDEEHTETTPAEVPQTESPKQEQPQGSEVEQGEKVEDTTKFDEKNPNLLTQEKPEEIIKSETAVEPEKEEKQDTEPIKQEKVAETKKRLNEAGIFALYTPETEEEKKLFKEAEKEIKGSIERGTTLQELESIASRYNVLGASDSASIEAMKKYADNIGKPIIKESITEPIKQEKVTEKKLKESNILYLTDLSEEQQENMLEMFKENGRKDLLKAYKANKPIKIALYEIEPEVLEESKEKAAENIQIIQTEYSKQPADKENAEKNLQTSIKKHEETEKKKIKEYINVDTRIIAENIRKEVLPKINEIKLGDIAYMEIRDKKDYTKDFNLTPDQRASVDMLKTYIEKHGHLPSENESKIEEKVTVQQVKDLFVKIDPKYAELLANTCLTIDEVIKRGLESGLKLKQEEKISGEEEINKDKEKLKDLSDKEKELLNKAEDFLKQNESKNPKILFIDKPLTKEDSWKIIDSGGKKFAEGVIRADLNKDIEKLQKEGYEIIEKKESINEHVLIIVTPEGLEDEFQFKTPEEKEEFEQEVEEAEKLTEKELMEKTPPGAEYVVKGIKKGLRRKKKKTTEKKLQELRDLNLNIYRKEAERYFKLINFTPSKEDLYDYMADAISNDIGGSYGEAFAEIERQLGPIKESKKKELIEKTEEEEALPYKIAWSMRKKGYKFRKGPHKGEKMSSVKEGEEKKDYHGKTIEDFQLEKINLGDKIEIIDPEFIYNRDKKAAEIFDLKNFEEGYKPNVGDKGIIDDIIKTTIGDKAVIVKLDNGKEIIIGVLGVKKIQEGKVPKDPTDATKKESIQALLEKYKLNENLNVNVEVDPFAIKTLSNIAKEKGIDIDLEELARRFAQNIIDRYFSMGCWDEEEITEILSESKILERRPRGGYGTREEYEEIIEELQIDIDEISNILAKMGAIHTDPNLNIIKNKVAEMKNKLEGIVEENKTPALLEKYKLNEQFPGPFGGGPGTGRGMGGGGGGRGRMGGNRPGAGPGGYCICPSCGEKVPHQAGSPCYNLTCPKCGSRMVRG